MSDPVQPSPDEVQARIKQRIEEIDVVAELNAAGQSAVSMDSDGRLVEHRPDGTTRPLEP